MWSSLLATVFCLLHFTRGSQLGLAVETRGDYTVQGHDKKVVCYWGTWANYRPEKGKFTPENVDPDLCTHLIYSFAGLDTNTWSIKSLDGWMDLETDYGLAGFRKATDLKQGRDHLKVTLAIGGWNEGSEKYSELSRSPEKRQKFVNSAVLFLKEHNFDGLDLDWEYPGKRGGIKEDKENFIHLIRELKEAFKQDNLLLTAAIGAPAGTIDVAYDVPNMYKYLDFVHVMCYDYHGKWDKKTGHNAPLHPRPTEPLSDQALNVAYSWNYLKKLGAIPEKTVLGVPLYGRAYTLMNPNSNKMGAPAKSTSFQGPFTREDGFMGYNEICLEGMDKENPWTNVFEEHHMAPYMYRGDSWMSYDNEKSIRLKSEYAYSEGLAGVMTWSIDTDDFNGDCGGPKFPLLRAINNALHLSSLGIYSSANQASSTLLALVSITLPLVLLWRQF